MAISTSKKGKLFTEINITPLTDIFLVLLIIMMVVAPTFQSMDNSINMPEINSGLTIEQKNATVSITKNGEMFLNGTPISESGLTDSLIALKPKLEKPEVVVKADAQTKSSEIMKVMNSAKAADFEKLIVAGEPLSKKDQKELAKAMESQQQEENMQMPMPENNNNIEEWSE